MLFAGTLKAQQSPISSASLFERLGGTDGISAIVDEAVEAHMHNPVIQARFLPYKENPKQLTAIKQHLKDFLSAGTGGSAKYKGRDMVTTHKGMNINPAEYMAVVDDIMMVLANHNMSDQTKKDILFITWSLKSMIISK